MIPPPLPLAERYSRFRDTVFSGVEEGVPLLGFEAPLNEIDLQSLWFSGGFGQSFALATGQIVTILDFGTWNSGEGPDFVDCTIQIDGNTRRGDIELDPDARDWERHRHGSNPAYANVILHVFLSTPPGERFFTRTVDHREVPQLLLTADLLVEGASPQSRQAAARLGRCSTPLRDMPPERVTSMIESAAQYRLQRKSTRLHALVAAQGRAQAVFQSLAQSLGYRFNQRPFAVLTQRLPIKRLLKEKPAVREGLLFGVSGFLDTVRAEDTQPETRRYLRHIWSEWWKHRDECDRWLNPQHQLRWKLSALRPGNHPQRRIGALIALLDAWPRVSAPLIDSQRWSATGWKETLLSLDHPFWSTHFTLLAEPAARPIALVGETRVLEMLANVVYPLLVPERTRLWAEYLELPALLDNQKVRRAVQRLFGDSPLAHSHTRRLHHHQGLLQIYEDFCLADDSACANCPFPERLKEWG